MTVQCSAVQYSPVQSSQDRLARGGMVLMIARERRKQAKILNIEGIPHCPKLDHQSQSLSIHSVGIRKALKDSSHLSLSLSSLSNFEEKNSKAVQQRVELTNTHFSDFPR